MVVTAFFMILLVILSVGLFILFRGAAGIITGLGFLVAVVPSVVFTGVDGFEDNYDKLEDLLTRWPDI